MENHLIKYSRKLSLILRHKPEVIGLNLDENGWAGVTELLRKFGQPPLSMEILEKVVATNDKKRFAFNDDKTKIRASQGHSIEVDLDLEAQIPPLVLFHGTASKNLQNIREQGLIKGSRQYVHLSADKTTAKKVGSRHGVPVILELKTQAMLDDGFKFYVSANGVWLIDNVPAKYLIFP